MAPTMDAHKVALLKASGFSLLELLVVVFIIGILATMFTLSVGVLGTDSELEKETDRLQALLQLAREDAVTHGRELGIHFYPGGYEFAAFEEDFIEYFEPGGDVQDQSEWVLLNFGTLLRPRQLPDGIVIELEIEGREIILHDKNESVPDDSESDSEIVDRDPYRPQIWLFSTGDMSPFVIRFRRELANAGVILEFSDDGSVELTEG